MLFINWFSISDKALVLRSETNYSALKLFPLEQCLEGSQQKCRNFPWFYSWGADVIFDAFKDEKENMEPKVLNQI